MSAAVDKYGEAVALWRAGLTVNQIAAALGLTRGQILGWCHRNRTDFPFRSEAARRAHA